MENQTAPSDALDRERLLPDARVREFFGVSAMTIWRWERNETLGFPLPVVINGRKFRRVGDVLDFRDRHRRAAPAPNRAA